MGSSRNIFIWVLVRDGHFLPKIDVLQASHRDWGRWMLLVKISSSCCQCVVQETVTLHIAVTVTLHPRMDKPKIPN